jgi:hypothetical protein
LTDWVRNGWLVEHRTSPQEIADLLGVADRDLRDGVVKDLREDWLRQNHPHLLPK